MKVKKDQDNTCSRGHFSCQIIEMLEHFKRGLVILIQSIMLIAKSLLKVESYFHFLSLIVKLVFLYLTFFELILTRKDLAKVLTIEIKVRLRCKLTHPNFEKIHAPNASKVSFQKIANNFSIRGVSRL